MLKSFTVLTYKVEGGIEALLNAFRSEQLSEDRSAGNYGFVERHVGETDAFKTNPDGNDNLCKATLVTIERKIPPSLLKQEIKKQVAFEREIYYGGCPVSKDRLAGIKSDIVEKLTPLMPVSYKEVNVNGFPDDGVFITSATSAKGVTSIMLALNEAVGGEEYPVSRGYCESGYHSEFFASLLLNCGKPNGIYEASEVVMESREEKGKKVTIKDPLVSQSTVLAKAIEANYFITSVSISIINRDDDEQLFKCKLSSDTTAIKGYKLCWLSNGNAVKALEESEEHYIALVMFDQLVEMGKAFVADPHEDWYGTLMQKIIDNQPDDDSADSN